MRRTARTTGARRTSEREAGFTLLEVVVALAIVAVLAGTVAPMAYKQLVRARKDATLVELTALSNGLIDFYEDTGRFPTQGEGLAALVSDPGVTGWQGPYVGDDHGAPVSAVTNDQFGNAYVYDSTPTTTPSGAADALIVSSGANGAFDTGSVGSTWDLDADEDDLMGVACVGPVNRDKTRDCLVELEAIGDAAWRHYEDQASFPATLAALSSVYMDPGVDNGGFVDPWNRAYDLVEVTVGGQPPTLTVRSFGPDRQDDNGGDDDIDRTVSGVPPGRKTTLWRLEIAQTVLNNQSGLALTGNWSTDRVALGLAAAFDNDGWGRALAVNVTSRTVYSIGPDGNAALTGDNLPAGVGP